MIQSAHRSSAQLVLKIEQMPVKMQRCNESKDECVMQAMLKAKQNRSMQQPVQIIHYYVLQRTSRQQKSK